MSANGGAPLLVTGMPRTATSWVGKMLEASGALVYVNEPLNPQHPPGRSPGVLRALKYTAGFGLGRLRGRRALLDDPDAVFAAPWMARRVGCQVVVTVRGHHLSC